jgi:hypothetical protein
MDFDPRDYDSRDEERLNGRGKGRAQDSSARDDHFSRLAVRSLNRDDDGRTLGQGPGSASRRSDSGGYDRSQDPRYQDRDWETPTASRTSVMSSHAALAFRVGTSGRSSSIAAASTPSAVRNHARLRASARSVWSPAAT